MFDLEEAARTFLGSQRMEPKVGQTLLYLNFEAEQEQTSIIVEDLFQTHFDV